MSAVAFDTLKLARKLRDTAHMPQEQAEGVADALAEAMSGAELATKSDIRELGSATKNDLAEAQAANKADMVATKSELKTALLEIERRLESKISEVKTDILKTIIAVMIVNSAVVLAAMFGLAKLLGH